MIVFYNANTTTGFNLNKTYYVYVYDANAFYICSTITNMISKT